VLLGDLIPGTDWDNNPSVVFSLYREDRPDWSHPNSFSIAREGGAQHTGRFGTRR